MNTPLQMEAQYDRQNRESARIIQASPDTFPDGSLGALWAKLVLITPAMPLSPQPLPCLPRGSGKQGVLFPVLKNQEGVQMFPGSPDSK